jgi:hypothetical protein
MSRLSALAATATIHPRRGRWAVYPPDGHRVVVLLDPFILPAVLPTSISESWLTLDEPFPAPQGAHDWQLSPVVLRVLRVLRVLFKRSTRVRSMFLAGIPE